MTWPAPSPFDHALYFDGKRRGRLVSSGGGGGGGAVVPPLRFVWLGQPGAGHLAPALTHQQGEPMHPSPSDACTAMASPPQLGVAQYLAEMNELAGDLFRKLDLIHDQFVGLQFDDASIVSPATGLLGLSAELRDRLYRCHDMANMIRACVDGG